MERNAEAPQRQWLLCHLGMCKLPDFSDNGFTVLKKKLKERSRLLLRVAESSAEVLSQGSALCTCVAAGTTSSAPTVSYRAGGEDSGNRETGHGGQLAPTPFLPL